MEKPGKHCLSLMVNINITSDVVWMSCTPAVLQEHTTFVVFFVKTHNPSLITEKTADKPRLGDILQDI